MAKNVKLHLDPSGKAYFEGNAGEVGVWLQGTLLKVDEGIRKRISRELTAAVKPAVERQRAAVRQVDSTGRMTSASVDRAWNALGRAAGSKTGLTERKISNIMARSGLRESVARTVRVQSSQTANKAELRVKSVATAMPADQRMLPKALNAGKWRHPLWGNKNHWVEQTVSPVGWFRVPIEKAMPGIHNKVYEVVSRAVDEA